MEPTPVHLGFLVDKLALGLVFFRVIQLSPVGIISTMPYANSFINHRHHIVVATDKK
jgi:hypothetical protein